MSDPTTSSASGATESSLFTLQVLSPSVNVPQPLFLELPVTTTVKQLKERIRSSVSTKPADDAQRLIHRGRLLARESETMLELFGEGPLRSPGHQTLHLVLRDLSDVQPTPTPSLSSNQPASSHSHTPGQHPQPHHGQPYVRPGVSSSPHPHNPFNFAQPPNPHDFQLPHIMSLQEFTQNRFGHLFQQQNSARHHLPPPNIAGPGEPVPPEGTRTVVREGIGPDGQRWRFTVNEPIATSQRPGRDTSPLAPVRVPTPTFPHARPASSTGLTGGLEARLDPHALRRMTEAGTATRTIADAMRRNASSSSLANLESHHGQQPIPPGVTTPLVPSHAGSAAGTPDPLRAAGLASHASTGAHSSSTSSASPEVYILSSPSGPRAILVNGNLGTYYSPLLRPMGLPVPPMALGNASGRIPQAQHAPFPQIIQRSPFVRENQPVAQANIAQAGQQPQPQPQHELQVPGAIQAQFGHGMENPQIHAIRLAQVWPHLWMIIRLAIFIWWFTSSTSSWYRWFTVVSIAIFIFIVNTGAVNGLAEQIWVPLRRHLENLIPHAPDVHGHQQQRPVAEIAQDGAAGDPNPAGPRGPDPADTAARLVQQRRENNANWLLNQARRLERAGILFIASLAPGLAERHIAQVEAEARAERQRQEEAQAAATAAAAAQADAENTNDNPAAADSGAQEAPEGDLLNLEEEPSNSVTEPNTSAPAQEAT